MGVDEGAGLLEHLLAGGGDFVDEPVLQRPLRRVLGALEEHLEQGVGDAHEAYGPGDAATRREQAEGDLGQADAGAGGVEGDAVVAGERDLVTAAEGRPVDGGDDGLAEGLDAAERGLDGVAGIEGVLGVLRADLDHVLEVAAA